MDCPFGRRFILATFASFAVKSVRHWDNVLELEQKELVENLKKTAKKGNATTSLEFGDLINDAGGITLADAVNTCFWVSAPCCLLGKKGDTGRH